MKADTLRKFLSLRHSLQKERAEIEAKLNRINEALGQSSVTERSLVAVPAKPKIQAIQRIENPMSLREAVFKVTSARPLGRNEIVQAVKKIGYRFEAKDPLNSLNGILYGKNSGLRNEGGKFSPVQKLGLRDTSKPIAKRKMSPAARANIAAAARARWAKIKKAGGKSLQPT